MWQFLFVYLSVKRVDLNCGWYDSAEGVESPNFCLSEPKRSHNNNAPLNEGSWDADTLKLFQKSQLFSIVKVLLSDVLI